MNKNIDSTDWQRWLSSVNLCICDTLADCLRHLKSVKTRPHLAVFCVPDHAVMGLLVQEGELLADMPIVMVLPDDDSGMLRLAYRLHPRFIQFMGNSLDTLLMVLRKMTQGSRESACQSWKTG